MHRVRWDLVWWLRTDSTAAVSDATADAAATVSDSSARDDDTTAVPDAAFTDPTDDDAA